MEVSPDRGEIEVRKPSAVAAAAAAAANSNNEETNPEGKVFAFDSVYDGRWDIRSE